MEELKLFVRLSFVILMFLTIFVIKDSYALKLVWSDIYNRYTLIWEVYNHSLQGFRGKEIKLPKILNIFRWKSKKL